MHHFKALMILFIAGLLVIGCSSGGNNSSSGENDNHGTPQEVEPKGDRLLGMDILNSTETGTFDSNFQKAKEFGIEFTGLHLAWNQIETDAETYTDPGDALSLFQTFCQAENFRLSLTIRPIDITGKTVPADLDITRFNSEVFITRFKRVIDFIFTKIDPGVLTSIQVGNEIDGYDTHGEHTDFWSDYRDFLLEMRAYVDSQYPGLNLGFTVTLLGVTTGDHKTSGVFEALADVVHVVGVTYYPLNHDFTVMDPSLVHDHFRDVTTKFSGKPIYLQEVGYQTSSECLSSKELQGEFVNHVFQAWDTHRDSIKLLEFVRMNDVSQQQAENFAGTYGIGDTKFIDYIRTLGFYTYDGTGSEKPGFAELITQAGLRGW